MLQPAETPTFTGEVPQFDMDENASTEPPEPAPWAPISWTFAGIPEIDPEWVASHRDAVTLIDVRRAGELEDEELGALDGIVHLPLGELKARAGELARDWQLWVAAIGYALVLTSPIVLMPLLVPFGKSLGLSGQQAAAFFAAMTPFSLMGKVVLGRMADVAPLKPLISLIVIVAASERSSP